MRSTRRSRRVELNLLVRLRAPVRANESGQVFGGDVGYVLSRDPDTIRAPDVSFVRADRLPAVLPTGFFDGAPDLAVEALSPNDRFPIMEQKVWQYFDAGATEVWVIDPEQRKVTVRWPGASAELLEIGATLTGGNVGKGFACQVSELFDEQ